MQHIVDAISACRDVKVLHVDMGFDANRTVITFAGTPEGVEEAAFQSIKMAAKVIDMSKQKGTHPRLGATDVMPIIPITGVSMAEAIALSYRLSERVANELSVPVYNYEKSAREDKRQRLELIRQGEYEGLELKMQKADWQADYGSQYNANTGATVIGARDFLLAYNVNLKTRDVAIAKAIAERIRESGRLVDGVRVKGCFKGLKAIGWDVPEYNLVQVSTNITDTTSLGMHQVYEKIRYFAPEFGVDVCGSELIGLSPKRCLLEAGQFYLGQAASEQELIQAAINHLGLASVSDYDAQERIIEYLV